MLPAGTITLFPGQGCAAGSHQQTCTASSTRDTSPQLLQAAHSRKKKTRATECNESPPSTEAGSDAGCLPAAALAEWHSQQPSLTARSRWQKASAASPSACRAQHRCRETAELTAPQVQHQPGVHPSAARPAPRTRCWSSPGQKSSLLAELYHSSPNRGKRKF